MQIKEMMIKKGELRRADLKKILPYQEPFLFLDKVTKLTTKTINSEYNIPKRQEFFKGHFKDYPLMPGMLTLEAVGQAGTLLARNITDQQEKKDILITKIEDAEFLQPLFPGDKIMTISTLIKREGQKFFCRGVVKKDKKTVCKVNYQLVSVDRDRFRNRGRKKR